MNLTSPSFTQRLKKRIWPLTAIYKLIIKPKKSYLYSTGWMESIKRGYPCGPSGKVLPWMNYAIISLLQERLTKDLTVFEFGSGYSTFFYADLVGQVISVEYNKKWSDAIQPKLPENTTLIYQEQDVDGEYCRTIARQSQRFDVVIVDGRDRVNCVKQGLAHLSESGIVILDDSDRERYQPAIEYAANLGFKVLHLAGLKPTNQEPAQSTIFYRSSNCLNL